jgi:hypothetical protein
MRRLVIAVSMCLIGGFVAIPSSAPAASGSGCTWVEHSFPAAAHDIDAISSSGPMDAWAISRQDFIGSVSGPIAFHWDGAGWKQFVLPSPAQGAELYSVSDVSPADAWMGERGEPTNPPTLQPPVLQHWNGEGWTKLRLPVGDMGDPLVSALSASNVWVAGIAQHATPTVAHWDGSTWTDYPLPTGTSITAIKALSLKDVWAAGAGPFYDPQTGQTSNVVEALNFNGTSWQTYLTVSDMYPDRYASLDASSPTNVWVAGSMQFYGVSGPKGSRFTLGAIAEHWDGVHSKDDPARWHFPPIVQDLGFGQVATMSSTQAWFVTNSPPNSPASLTRWDESQWTSETFPFGVVTVARVGQTDQLWLVGQDSAPTYASVALLGTCV